MDGQQLFFLIATLAVIVMILIWALMGRSSGADASGHDAASLSHDDAAAAPLAHETATAPLSTAAVDAAIAVQADEAAASGKPRIAAAIGEADDLRKIKGVGPKLNSLLAALGVTRYDQIATWTAADIAEIDPYLGNFKGRIVRDNWIEQAGFLARNDIAGFELKFGKL